MYRPLLSHRVYLGSWKCPPTKAYFSGDGSPGDFPSSLHGKFTWRVPNLAAISKRELRSESFSVGEYAFYILAYPTGYGEGSSHLSLFLCVAEHDRMLPGDLRIPAHQTGCMFLSAYSVPQSCISLDASAETGTCVPFVLWSASGERRMMCVRAQDGVI